MRSAACTAEDETGASPEPDLDAKADEALDRHLELVQRVQARLAAGMGADHLLTEIINLGIHLEELRGQMHDHAAAKDALKGAWVAGWEARGAAMPEAAQEVPARRSRRATPGPRPALNVVRDLPACGA